MYQPSILPGVLLLTFALFTFATPTAKTLNGTYEGIFLPEWDQDAFLGIPYAQPPVGDLRFRWPQSINTSFEGVGHASQYGASCMQYGTDFNLSEDCLSINIIRPAGVPAKPLPVIVWSMSYFSSLILRVARARWASLPI
jgi:carboxylesterase type B